MNRIIIRALRLGSLVEKNDLPAFDTDGNTENIKKRPPFSVPYSRIVCVSLSSSTVRNASLNAPTAARYSTAAKKIIDKAALLFLLLLSRSFLKKCIRLLRLFLRKRLFRKSSACLGNRIVSFAAASPAISSLQPNYSGFLQKCKEKADILKKTRKSAKNYISAFSLPMINLCSNSSAGIGL